MPSLKKSVICSASLGLLSACGGGGTTDGSAAPGGGAGDGGYVEPYRPVPALGSGSYPYAALSDAAHNLQWFADGLANTGTIIENIPTTGRATYNGMISINKTTRDDPDHTPDDLYYGRIQIDADFVTTAVSGTMGEFGHLDASVTGGTASQTLDPVPGLATFSGTITDQFMGGTTSKGMYATNVAGLLDGAVVTGDISGRFYTDLPTGRGLIKGDANLNIGTDVDINSDFLAAE